MLNYRNKLCYLKYFAKKLFTNLSFYGIIYVDGGDFVAEKKLANRGSNIADILNPDNAPPDAKTKALRRTMLIKSLNTR